jgi:hypothetical protein
MFNLKIMTLGICYIVVFQIHTLRNFVSTGTSIIDNWVSNVVVNNNKF